MPWKDALFECEKLCGIWPEKNRLKYYFRATIHIALMIYVLAGIIRYLIYVFTDPKATATNKADGLYTAQSCSNFFFDHMGCLVLQKSSLEFFDHVKNFDIFGRPERLVQIHERINKHVKYIMGYCVVAAGSLSLYYWATYKWCLGEHEILGDINYCGYICGMKYPYDFDSGILFMVHKVLVTYTFTLLCSTGMMFICAGYVGIEYIVAKIDHLKEKLSGVLDVDDPKERLCRLKICIKYQIHIIELSDELNTCYSVINTPAIFFYSTTIGVCLYSLSIKYTTKAVLMIGGYLIGTFLLAVAGQRLQDKSESVAFAAYNMRWYDADVNFRKYLLFVIARSQRPLTYKAGAFGSFSLPVFMNVLRGSYTYMTMQNNVK